MNCFKMFAIVRQPRSLTRIAGTAASLLSLGFTLATSVGMSTQALAFAGNGSGINGPDLAGISIPAVVDSSFQENDLDRTLRACAQASLKPLADVLQTHGTQMNFFTATTTSIGEGTDRVRHVSRMITAQGTAIGASRGKNDAGPTCSINFFDQSVNAPDQPTRLELSACAIGNGVYDSTERLPHYEYDLSLNNVRFDEWGNPTGGSPAITQLHVLPLSSSAKLKFINAQSGQTIALTFNAASMAACMKAQAQRAH